MPSNKFLAEVTHAIVTFTSVQDAQKTGIQAYIELCYGPGDDNSIAYIPLTKVMIGRTASSGVCSPNTQVLRDGKEVSLPVFKGELAQILTRWCNKVLDRIKKDVAGGGQPGKRYRVTKKGAEELVKEEPKVLTA